MRPILLKGHERCARRRRRCRRGANNSRRGLGLLFPRDAAARVCAPAADARAGRRPLTFLKYNAEGDLLMTCAKDHTPNLWYADDGERIGTYSGHNGAVWTCDLTGALCSGGAGLRSGGG